MQLKCDNEAQNIKMICKRENVMKKLIRLLMVMALMSLTLYGRELRNPLYQTDINVDIALWTPEQRLIEGRIKDWFYNISAAFYHNGSSLTFLNHFTSKTEPLSALLFGEAAFRAIQAFGTTTSGQLEQFLNPILSFSLVTPFFSYTERGVSFGFGVNKMLGADGIWNCGFRLQLPYRMPKTTQQSPAAVQNTLQSIAKAVFRERVPITSKIPQTLDNIAMVDDSYAYRLDLLASLATTANPPLIPLVNFSAPLSIAQHDMTGSSNPDPYPVHVVQGVLDANGNIVPPPLPFTLNEPAVGSSNNDPAGIADLLFNGVGNFTSVVQTIPGGNTSITNRARFNSTTDYTALANNQAALRSLYLVPTGVGTNQANFGITEEGRYAQDQINKIINSFTLSAIETLEQQGLNFNGQQGAGLGDLTTQFYVSRNLGKISIELNFGVLFPTGAAIENLPGNSPQVVLLFPNGNNKHYEISFGTSTTFNVNRWLLINMNATYNFALRGREFIAAPFAGATIKNLGPTTQAIVSWQFFNSSINFTLTCPFNPRITLNPNIAIYAKRRDHVIPLVVEQKDLFGNIVPLDASVVENRTDSASLTLGATIGYNGDNFSVSVGGSQTIAGKNAPKSAGYNASFAVNF
jgi:hypothetical protein